MDKAWKDLVIFAQDRWATEEFSSLRECCYFFDIRYTQDLLRKIYTGATADDGATTFDVAPDSPWHVERERILVRIKGKLCKRWHYLLVRDSDA